MTYDYTLSKNKTHKQILDSTLTCFTTCVVPDNTIFKYEDKLTAYQLSCLKDCVKSQSK